jgi:putative hydrolase of the HAD superfamily
MSRIAFSHEPIKAVVFDFGNVICKFDNKIFLMRISDHTGESIRELEKKVYRASGLASDYERGMVSSDDFFDQVAAICGLRMSKEEFIRAYTDKFTPIPETYQLIRSLKRKYKLGLLSNTSAWDFEYGIRTTEVFPLFDAVTVSFEVHALKPEKDIYLDVFAKLKVKPLECVYIDDIEKYVEAARNLGMNAVRYRSPQQLVESLRELQVM